MSSTCWLPALVSVLGLGACGADPNPAAPIDAGLGEDAACATAPLEAAIAAKLDQARLDPDIAVAPDVTVLIETFAGRRFEYNRGTSTPATVYESASTSKLVTGAVFMELVERGVLSLDSKPADLIDFWLDETVLLRHLLAFTSGYADEPPCLNNGFSTLEACVQNIWTANAPNNDPPGTAYVYSSTHMAIAGLMALEVTGASTWDQVFQAFKDRTGLFPTGVYDLPSLANPRLAGGMHWTGEEYLAFLRALATGSVLTDDSRAQLFGDHRGQAQVGPNASPAYVQFQEDWSYGFGNWLECESATTLNSFDCGAGHRNSSAGAYGAYPVIDFDHEYFAMVAQQGPLGSGFRGVELLRAAEAEIEAWAAFPCD